MNELDYLKAQEESEARGEAITAIYHSHVGYGAYLSEFDQECIEEGTYPFPEAVHIVISVVGGAVRSIGLFERESHAFHGRRVEPAPP